MMTVKDINDNADERTLTLNREQEDTPPGQDNCQNGQGRSRFRMMTARIVRGAVRSVWFWLFLLIVPALALRGLAANVSGFADGYCHYFYRYVSVFWNNISGIVPFSVGEILLLLLPLAAVAYIAFVIVSVVRSKGQRIKKLLLGFIRPLSLCMLVMFLFVTNCGINYYCSDVAAMSGLELREPSAEDLYEVCVYLADRAAECRSRLSEDENGAVSLDKAAASYTARDAVNALHQSYDYIPDGYGIPKGVMLSRGMSYLNITGVYFPFTFEANVNTDAPDYTIPFTMCHELAHVRGFMHEQDANFIAYLSCIYSDDYGFMYSGYAQAISYVSRYLRMADKTLYDEFRTHLTEGILRDYAFSAEYWRQFETPVAEAASAVNDSYLKHNAQPEGIKSYDRITDLIIAHYFQFIKS